MSAAPAVSLTPVGPAEAEVLTHLFQLYLYDFSELLAFDIGADGLFAAPRPDGYWLDPRYQAFLFHAHGHLAGFAVVDSQSRLTGTPVWDMNEFFVLRRHRRAGVGGRAASAVFDRFRGAWEVRELVRNVPAQAFWRRVIGEYTGECFTEVAWDDARWRGPVQRFESVGG